MVPVRAQDCLCEAVNTFMSLKCALFSFVREWELFQLHVEGDAAASLPEEDWRQNTPSQCSSVTSHNRVGSTVMIINFR